MSGSAELSGGKVSTASPPPPATHPPDSSLEPPPPGGGGHHSGTPAGGPPPGLSIPDGFQCTRKAACVKPAGHIGRCKTKFATEEERRQALQAHVSAFLAAGGSDSDSEDEVTPAAGRRGPGAAALAPSTQDILLDIQQQLAQLTTTMGLQQQVISGLAGQQAGQGVASGSSLATLPQQGPTAVAPPSPHPSLAGAAAPAALQQQLESLLGNNPFATDPSAFTNATAGQLPGLNAHAQQVAAAAGTMPLHTTVPIPITGIGASPGVSVSAPVVVAAAVWLVQRQRQRRQQLAAAAGKAGSLEGSDEEAPTDGPSPQLSNFPSTGAASAATPASMHKFNPFQLGGSGGSGDPTSTLAAFSSTSTGQGSGQRIPLTAAAHLLQAGASRPGSGSSNASPHAGLLAARLEALQREPPAWLIDPNQLMLELTGDGRLLLLGVGHYGACYRGWLLPQPEGAKAAAAGAGAGAAPPALAKQVAPGGALATTIGSSEVRVAIKVLNIADMDAAFFKEADILHRLGGSPHVVALHGACVVDQHMVVVMELMQGGDLAGALASDASGELSWGRRGREIALSIAEGLAFLHANNVTHRDLKSQNVLLTKTLQAKVADVGGATIHSHTYVPEGASDFRGTLAYAAPELLLAAPCTNKIDSFSFGIVLWEIVTHEVPRRGFVQPPPPSDACPAGVSQLIRDCLQTDPRQRPSAAEIVERLKAM